LLVTDIAEISHLGMSPQFQALRQCVKQFCEVGIVRVALNLLISLREEDGFFRLLRIEKYARPEGEKLYVSFCT
jgi:hypothetical protein